MEVVVSNMRWPVTLHRKLKEAVEREGKSMNQFVVDIVQAWLDERE